MKSRMGNASRSKPAAAAISMAVAAFALKSILPLVSEGCLPSNEASKASARDSTASASQIDSSKYSIRQSLGLGDTVEIGAIKVRLDRLESDSSRCMAEITIIDSGSSPPLKFELGLFETTPAFLDRSGQSYVIAFSKVEQGASPGETRAEIMANSISPSKTAKKLFSLASHPNPFNPSTTISFELAAASHVNVTVFNLLGEPVAVLFDGQKNAGRHTLNFNASSLSAGMYLVKIRAGGESDAQKLILMK